MDPDKDKSLEERLDMIQQRFRNFKTWAPIPADNAKWLMKTVKPQFEQAFPKKSNNPVKNKSLEKIFDLLDKKETQKAALLFRKLWASPIAETLLKLGKGKEALHFASQLQTGDRENFLRSLAMWYAAHYDLAQALEIIGMINDPDILAYAKSNIVHILCTQKQFPKAKEIAFAIHDQGYREDAILEIVKAYLQHQQIDEAIRFVDSLLNTYDKGKPAKVIAASLKALHQEEKVREVQKLFSLLPAPIRMAA